MVKFSGIFVLLIIVTVVAETFCGNVTRVRRRRNNNTSLVDFIRRSMQKYGESNVQAAFEALDEKDITQVIQILIGQTDKQVADDILSMQMYAAKSDPDLVKMIRQVYAGQQITPKEMFKMDEKIKIYPWWRRLRGKIIQNTDKYIAIYINNRNKPPSTTTPTTTTTAKPVQ